MFLRSISLFLLAAALPLSGCEMLSGDKAKDGESVGYACRLSNKLPEDCMKENSVYTPTSVLAGWKAADQEALDRKAEEQKSESAKTGGEAEPEGEKPASGTAEEKPAATEPQANH